MVNGPVDLRNALLEQPDQIVQTLTEKLMTYALGRSVEYYDMPAVRKIVREAAAHDYRFSAILTGIVLSEPFRMGTTQKRGGRGGPGAGAVTEGELPMFVTKKHLSRRTVLRGMGATVALPLLDAMIPARTALAQTAAKPLPRMGFIYFPHGAVMDKWTPAKEGAEFDLPPILEAARAVQAPAHDRHGPREQARQRADARDHAGHVALGRSPAREPRSVRRRHGSTRLRAEHIGQDTPLPSLEVSTEEAVGGGACDRSYGCSYGATISFRTPSTPLPMEFNPSKLFQKLFGQGDTPEERELLAAQYSSILDVVADKARDLQRRVGPSDRQMLDDYLESVREIERRVQKMEERDLSYMKLPDAPVGIPNTFDEQMNLMFDTVALAWQANLTRITSFMMAAEVSNMTYNHVEVPDAFHALSHHQNNAAKIERLLRVQVYHTQQFAKFVQKLADMPDGDGSMLDHSILLYGSNMSNSNAHDHFPLPSAVLGGGCGHDQRRPAFALSGPHTGRQT